MTTYYILCLIVGIILYMVAVDQNVSDYIILQGKIIKVKIERFFWMIRFHPKNPITNFTLKFKYDRIAKELEQELKEKK